MKLQKLLFIIILGLGIHNIVKSQSWAQLNKIVASDREANDIFGCTVSIYGNYAIVGAHHADNLEGAAYIFERDGSGKWKEKQKLKASDHALKADNFGNAVSISGNYAIVGAYAAHPSGADNFGAAYIFERDGSGIWLEKAKIDPDFINHYFGYSVSISGDYAIVGTGLQSGVRFPYSMAAYIYERNSSGNWIQKQKIVSSDITVDDHFSLSVGISGNNAIVGSYGNSTDASNTNSMVGAGAAYIFERDGSGTWLQKQKIVAIDRTANDWFGYQVSISDNFIIVGAINESQDENGANTLNQAGSVYILEKDVSDNWTQKQKIVPYDRNNNDYFGSALNISGKRLIVGAWAQDKDTNNINILTEAGAAYIFEQEISGKWSQKIKLVASDRAAGDVFGWSVGISNNNVIVGATYDTKDTNGSNPLFQAGSAYIFTKKCKLPISVSQGNFTICSGDSVLFAVSGAISYIWSPATGLNTTSGSPILAHPMNTTTYLVTGTDDQGCNEVASVSVQVNALPSVNAGTSVSILQGNSTILSAVGNGVTFIWSPGIGIACTNCKITSASPLETRTYTITTSDAFGCKSEDTVTVRVLKAPILCGIPFVPDAFSPNGDGDNEKFIVHYNCIQTINIEIFNRWGNSVYIGKDATLGWDGRKDGIDLNPCIFFYTISIQDTNGKPLNLSGNLSLIR